MSINLLEVPKPVITSHLAREAALLAMREIRGETDPAEVRVVDELRYLEGVQTFVAFDDATGLVLATASMRPREYPVVGEAMVSQVATSSTQRRRGLGRRVFGYLEDEARLKGIDRLRLMSEPGAVPFYLKLGFTKLPSSNSNTHEFVKAL